MDVIVKKSKISGKGVFANRDFKKGEVVLAWNPERITKAEAEKLPDYKKHYLLQQGTKYFLMQTPEKYVNYSCDSNTAVGKLSDIAKRDIKKGEEITSNYDEEGILEFNCNCGSKNCKVKMK